LLTVAFLRGRGPRPSPSEHAAADPRERAANVPDAFAELVVRLMAKQPACRPASAAEVAAQLRAFERELSARS
jgi:hypothetical protein